MKGSLEEVKSFLLFQCEAFIYTGKFLLEHPGYRKEEQMCKQTLKSSDALIGVGYEIFTNRCGLSYFWLSVRTLHFFVFIHNAPLLSIKKH